MPLLQQQPLYKRYDEQQRSQQRFDIVQKVCQTELSQNSELVEVSGNLFGSTDSITLSISSDMQVAAAIAQQVLQEFATTNRSLGQKRER